MDIKTLLECARIDLQKHGIEQSRLEAEILLGDVLDCNRIFFYAHPKDCVEFSDEEKYFKLIKRRCLNEPIAYIIGKKEFMGLEYEVNPNVLIPRPDTEPMVEYLIAWLKKSGSKNKRILDLCTGSGAIGIALKYYYPQGEVFLSDISDQAIAIAKKNAENLVNCEVQLCQGDLFEAVKKTDQFDLIVSNPPYIKKNDMGKLACDILNYEPHLALDGGESGLDFYERIIIEAKSHLKDEGILALEIGDDQDDAVNKLLEKNNYIIIKKESDLTGHVRCLVGEK
jgi:release factor glutamine methyltransferase